MSRTPPDAAATMDRGSTRTLEALKLLATAGADLLDRTDVSAALESFYKRLADLLQLDVFLHYELAAREEPLRLLVSGGLPAQILPSLQTLELGVAICGSVGLMGRAEMVTSVQESVDPRTALIRTLGVTAYVCNPLLHSGVVIGTLSFGSRRESVLSDETLTILRAASAQVAMVAHRRRTEKVLRDSEEKLRDADQKKDEFLAVLAHELRNPLAPIRSGLEILQHPGSNPDVKRQATEMMTRQLGHIVRLVDDLLDVSRIKSGKLHVSLQRVRVSEALSLGIEAVRPALNAKRHRLAVSGMENAAVVHGDRVRLAQIFGNLLNNAARYTPVGGRIAVDVQSSDHSLTVTVADNGPGIDEADLCYIFDPFVQAGGHGPGDGMGIGLALVKALTELHGGEVLASNLPSGGAVFELRLPLLRGDSEQTGTEEPVSAPPILPTPRRVLVVDDNEDAADSLAALLEMEGAIARAVNDGEAAIEETRTFEPEFVFMDLGMPGMSGLEAARRIRALPLNTRPFIVAVTGWGQAADRKLTAAAGFDAHMVKPVRAAAITEMLTNARN